MKKGFCFALSILSLLASTSAWAITEIASNPTRVYDEEYPGWFIYDLNPGETITDVVRFTNVTADTQRARIYVSDYVETGNGGFGIKNLEDEQFTLGKWTTINDDDIMLNPFASVNVEFTIRIPSNAPKMRTAGGIMIEMLDPVTGERQTTINSEGVRFSYRSGSRIYIFPDGTSWNSPIYYEVSEDDTSETTPPSSGGSSGGRSSSGSRTNRNTVTGETDASTGSGKTAQGGTGDLPGSQTQLDKDKNPNLNSASEESATGVNVSDGETGEGNSETGGGKESSGTDANTDADGIEKGPVTETKEAIRRLVQNFTPTDTSPKSEYVMIAGAVAAGSLTLAGLTWLIGLMNWMGIPMKSSYTLAGLSKQYHVSVDRLKKRNKVKTLEQLKLKKKVYVPRRG